MEEIYRGDDVAMKEKKEQVGSLFNSKKIVQISVAQSSDKNGAACWVLIALCKDGTLWERDSKSLVWEMIPIVN